MDEAQTPLPRTASLWFGMVGAAIAWALHFYLIWAVTEMGCRLGVGRSDIAGVSVIDALVLLMTLVGGAVIVAAGLTAYRNWRAVSGGTLDDNEVQGRSAGRASFMSILGMAFAVIFMVVVIYTTVPVFVLPTCVGLP